MQLKLIYEVTIAPAVGPPLLYVGSHNLNQVLPWEQALRRLPGKGISGTVVRVEVFGLGNK